MTTAVRTPERLGCVSRKGVPESEENAPIAAHPGEYGLTMIFGTLAISSLAFFAEQELRSSAPGRRPTPTRSARLRRSTGGLSGRRAHSVSIARCACSEFASLRHASRAGGARTVPWCALRLVEGHLPRAVGCSTSPGPPHRGRAVGRCEPLVSEQHHIGVHPPGLAVRVRSDPSPVATRQRRGNSRP